MINCLGLGLEAQVRKNKKDIEDLQTATAPVTSVNTKTGDVVLDATDIKLKNGTKTTLEANINRIDEQFDTVDNEISALQGITDSLTDDVGDLSSEVQSHAYDITTLNEFAGNAGHETWTFTLDDDTTVTKEVMIWSGT